ncbi:TadE/TadG family type IV pilus assembly protein [Roseovarius sp.]|uniref:TadE/TadG family type IV pilus assembly protein n=1 Tax=Roseovarius sp. TaxID=1486281 RepID=UPI0025F900F3|nr:TadE/TadG family type IV pilus assembly protein [Roseovarius sp.]
MKRRLTNLLRAFMRDDSGTASMEFVMVVPLFFVLLLFSVELGFVTLRATMLERGLDIAVREIRLGTGTVPTHDETKAIICERAIIITNCAEKLQLEMVPNDLRNYTALSDTPDCTDNTEPTKPVRAFIPGVENQLMVLRACVKFEPIFPNAVLGAALAKDSSGEAAIVATTAFVQEPL